jgi:hypothetical protein
MTLVQACVETFEPSACPLNILYPSPATAPSYPDSAIPPGLVSEDSLTEWIIMSLEEVDPDSTSLLPHLIAVIDLGDRLIVRIGRSVDIQKYGTPPPPSTLLSPLPLLSLSEKLVDCAMQIISRRSEKRYPVPSCHLIREGTPQERMIFSRLNPSHCDSKEIIENRSAYWGHLGQGHGGQGPQQGQGGQGQQQFLELLSHYPYTDQRSYIQYLSQLVPKFAHRVEVLEYHKQQAQPLLSESKGVLSVKPMERGMGLVTPTQHTSRGDGATVIGAGVGGGLGEHQQGKGDDLL